MECLKTNILGTISCFCAKFAFFKKRTHIRLSFTSKNAFQCGLIFSLHSFDGLLWVHQSLWKPFFLKKQGTISSCSVRYLQLCQARGGQCIVSLAATPICLASAPSNAELAPMDFAGLTVDIYDQICLHWVVWNQETEIGHGGNFTLWKAASTINQGSLYSTRAGCFTLTPCTMALSHLHSRAHLVFPCVKTEELIYWP